MSEESGRRKVAEAELAKAQAEEEARRQRVLSELAKARTAEETRTALSTLLAAVTTTYAAVASGDEHATATGLEAIFAATNDVRRASRPAAPRATNAGPARSAGSGARPDRNAPRPLRPDVVAHLTAYPDKEFTPTDIAKVLNRSSGAVANALDTLVRNGQAVLTSERPHRYRAATSAVAPATNGTDTSDAD